MEAGLGESRSDPMAACADGLTTGHQVLECDGVMFDVEVPSGCESGCGIVVDVHGATMSAEMEDNNTSMRAIGSANQFIVIQPSAPAGFPWAMWAEDDGLLVEAFTDAVATALAADRDRIHLMGFSDGGMMTWEVLCSGTELFASVAPAAAANGESCEVLGGLVDVGGCLPSDGDEFVAPGVDVLFMAAREDALVDYSCAENQIASMTAAFGLGGPTVVASDDNFDWQRFVGSGERVVEVLSHDYTSDNIILRGHCYPGSTDAGDAEGQLFSFACTQETAFHWGEAAMQFFLAHPK